MDSVLENALEIVLHHQMLQNQWKGIKHIKNIIPKPSNATKPMEKHKKHNSLTIKCYKTNGKA